MKKIFTLVLVLAFVVMAKISFAQTDSEWMTMLVEDTLKIEVDNAEVRVFSWSEAEIGADGEIAFEVRNTNTVPEITAENGLLKVDFGTTVVHDAIVNVYLSEQPLRELFVMVERGDITLDSNAEYISVKTTYGSVEAHAYAASVEVNTPYLWCGSSIKNALTDLAWLNGEEEVFKTVFNPGVQSKQQIEISAGFEVAIE